MIIEPPNWFQAIWIAVAPSGISSDLPGYVLWWTLEISGLSLLVWGIW